MPAQSRTWRRSNSRLASYPCIGRSASRLSSTRSGVVNSRFSARAIPLLSSAAPIPPLALLRWQTPVPCLRHRRAKNIQAADVLRLPRDSAQLLIKFLWASFGKLRHAGNAEQFKTAQHRRTNGNQVSQLALFCGHEILLDTVFVSFVLCTSLNETIERLQAH